MPVEQRKPDSGAITPERREYACLVLSGWDKLTDRDPIFCLNRCDCSHVVHAGSIWGCEKVIEINSEIADRIADFERAKK